MIFNIELILTRQCNQTCYYCNLFDNSVNPSLEIDLDFIKYCYDLHNTDLKIEFCGGEPGLISNLDDLYKITYNHPNVKEIQVMSNGLVRKKGFDWLDKIIYCEHLIFDIDGKNIVKFYDMDFCKDINVVVTTEKTITSLLNNFEYFQQFGLFQKNFWYKLMNPKKISITGFEEKLKTFFKKINDKHSYNMVEGFLKNIDYSYQKRLCSINPPHPTIDLETNEYCHCGTYLMKCKRYNISSEIIRRNMICELFEYEDYCKSCYVFDSSPNKLDNIIKSKKGIYVNRGVI